MHRKHLSPIQFLVLLNSFSVSQCINDIFVTWYPICAQTEVKLSGELSHPNVSRILGYCSQDMELLLVYEFMHKRSLENHILTRKLTFVF
ncbi:putative protein kinase RLK-Pelle-RLCK-VIIa-2 family [Helianthus annuus]|nr:putative protein kinase RLK-Pelle-RLCK-VIIa-2 family [Helianthus annuus]